jgi:hypothetical protein
MKAKILNIIIIAGALVITYSSCDEGFLERRPKGTVFTEGLGTAEGVDALLIGAYSLLDGAGSYSGWPAESYAASVTNWIWNTASDDAYKGTTLGDEESAGRIERFVYSPANEKILHKWQVMYDGVSRANDVLRALAAARENISDIEADHIEGQAKFLRAWYHFELQRMHHKIPYVTEDVEKPDEVSNATEVWDKIEQDLQFGVERLPESFEGAPGRADKYAAMAVKGYVHMFQKEWQDAASLFDNIINSGRFELADSYHHNFDGAHENNIESIFEIQYSVNDGTLQGRNGGADHWTTHPHGGAGNSPLPTCCGMYQPSQDLVNAFEVNDDGLPLLGFGGPKYNDVNLENDMGITSNEEFIPTDKPVDPRLDHIVARRGIPFLDWGIFTGTDWIRDQTHGGPYEWKKVTYRKADQGEFADAFARANAINWRSYRFGHVLLWRAECAVELNDLETARELVNRVRRRAANDVVMGKVNTYIFDGRDIEVDWDTPAANYKVGEYISFPSQEYARAAVHMEIRLEGAMEGRRFYDLVRWGEDGEVINEFIKNDSEFRTYMQGSSYNPEKHDHWPLPESQVDLQEGVLLQDPAW